MSSPESPRFAKEEKGVFFLHPREGLKKWSESQTAIQAADPLRADPVFEIQFPQANQEGNIDSLLNVAREIIPTRDVDAFSLIEARAAKRDLGFVATSLARNGGAIQQVEGLESILLELSKRTGEVPGQTIFDYTSYNPQDGRTRAFTTWHHERTVIEQTYKGTKSLAECMYSLDEASDVTIFDSNYAPAVEEAASYYAPMSDSIFNIRRKLPTGFFGNFIQKNFHQVTIGANEYHGAGGGQIPVFLIDKLLGTVSTEEAHEREIANKFNTDNLVYSPPEIRTFANSIAKKESLLEVAEDTVKNNLEGKNDAEISVARESISALMRMREEINIFRIRHQMLAKLDLETREEQIGTGGYDLEMLKFLAKLTKHAGYRLDKTAEELE